MKFRGFTLDKFQEEAAKAIDEGQSVVVSAATGTGKTLIADYVIDKYLKKGKKIVYTAPIKALSNQKYSDFKELYGEEKVGILTGDVSINHDAPLRIMTTEIYRNMLLSNDPDIEHVSYVIFDEIHYLGDVERGTVWEESIIFSKDHTRFLCLSATIPNARQFTNWIKHIKGHEIKLVTETKRAVPLKTMFYDSEKGFASLKEIKNFKELDKHPSYHKVRGNRKKYFQELRRRRNKGHIELINDLGNKLPAIYFCFSRALTQKKAQLLANKKDLLSNEQSVEVKKIIREKLQDEESTKKMDTTFLLRECLSKGIGFHHAGLLHPLKQLVEKLFEKGLVKVLFATETFAVGINMPAKTVIFDSLEKYDGISFRYLESKEFFQLAGRAGRRGIDEVGYVICYIERKNSDLNTIQRVTQGDDKPLSSQFKLSYNTVLNLIHNHNPQEIEVILEKSLYSYQQTGRQSSERIKRSFEKRKKTLLKYGFLAQGTFGLELTEKGLFGMRIYQEELLVSEIFCSKQTKLMTNLEILLIVGRICFEERKNTQIEQKSRQLSDKLFKKFKDNRMVKSYFLDNPVFVVEHFLKRWYEGCEFEELVELTNMLEGDIFRWIRQIIDLLQQIQHATLDDSLISKVKEIQEKIDRDVISVTF